MDTPKQRNLYHYLFGRAPGKMTVSQVADDAHIMLSFPETNALTMVEFDSRQHGILAAFDGTLLWGSLPRRNKSLLYYKKLLDLDVPVGQLRNPVAVEEKPQYQILYRGRKQVATVPIYRCVVLLPFNFRTIVRKYDEKSLKPKYIIMTTDKKSVNWTTTSW